jgi:long-chain acyl-CoA synthetase
MSSSFLSVLIQRQAGKYGDRVALRYRDYKTETWIPVSWNQFAATVKTVSNALIELGIGIQENIAVFSQNKPECLYVDFGAFGVRAVTVPFYATSSEAQVHYMVGDAEIRYIFVGEQLQYDVAFRVMQLGSQLKQIIIFDKEVKRDERDQTSIYFDDFLKLGEAHPHQAEVDKRTSESGNGDLANILYTSGTTGDSKGVMLHHSCYEAAIPAHDERFPQLGDQDVIMNFLPFTHVFERAWTCWCLSMGCTLSINLRPADIQKTIKEIRPTAMCSVPRFWEKVYAGVQEKINETTGLKKKLMLDAIKVGQQGKPLDLFIMCKLLLQCINPLFKQIDNFRFLQQFLHTFIANTFFCGILFHQFIFRNYQSRNKFTFIGNNRNLIDITVYHQFGFNGLRSDILPV